MSEPQLPPPPDDDFERAASAFFGDADLFVDHLPEAPAPPPTEAEPEPIPEVEAEAQPDPIPEPDPRPDVEPEPTPDPNRLPDFEAEADPEPVPDCEPQPDPTPEPQPDPAPEPEPEPEPEPAFLAAPTDLPIYDETPPAYSGSIWNEQQHLRRRLVRRVAIGAVLTWVGVMIVMVAYGVLSLQNAKAQLSGVKNELSLATLDDTNVPGAKATAHSMGRAHSMFNSPVILPLKVLPVVGRQLRALNALSGAGERAIRIGIDTRAKALPIAKNPPKDGEARLATLAATEKVAHDGTAALAKLDLGPAKNLIGPLADTRTKFGIELNRIGDLLQRTEASAAGLAAFLRGPSTYAVFAANNAEMRAGSGMYLSAGTLEVKDGNLSLGPMKSIYDLPPAPTNVALEYDYLRLWGLQAPGSDYRFVNMTPRFPTSGALLQRMWAASGAKPVDGIMVIDPVAAVDLLKLVGEVKVGDTIITPKNGLQLFLHDQYLTYPTKITAKAIAQRRDFLTDVVQSIFGRLNSGAFSAPTLGQAFSDAASGRHLMAWTPNAKVQTGWNALGMDGTLPDDSVMFALQNRGGNKLDWFQTVSAVANATVSRTGSDVTMEFLVTNAVPKNEPAYIAGPVPGSYVTTPGEYVGIASVNLPKDATKVKLTGGDYDMASGPDGNTQVVSRYVQLSPGESVRLKLRFTLPPGTRSLTVLPSARVPSVFWHLGKTSWHDTKPQVIAW